MESSTAWLLGGPRAPVAQAVGFIEAPLDAVTDELRRWRRGIGRRCRVNDRVGPYPDCLRRLEPLRTPWNRELLIGMGTWTAYLNNDRNGGDPFPVVGHLSGLLNRHGVIAVHQPMTEAKHASTQFQLLGPAGEPPLHYMRTLAAHAEDGRWSWHASGTPLPFEETGRYDRRLKRERLTRPVLVTYLGELGIDVDDEDAFGDCVLVT